MINIYNGDCLEIMERLEDKSVDLVLTDPPYGMNYQSHMRKVKYDKIQNDSDLSWLDTYFKECERLLKDNRAIYCFCSWHNVDKFKVAFERYFKLKNIIIWEKNNHGCGDLKAGYAPKYELILYGNKGRCFLKEGRKEDIIKCDKTGNKLHPTQKPVDLLEYLIKNSTNPNEVVFDGFMGSGSTGVASQNLDRDFIGIEIDSKYFDTARERMEDEKIK